jgi:hypothetical protein
MISLHFSWFHFSRICLGLVILSTAAAAANPSVDLEILLLRLEQEIVAGHSTAPPEDNAAATWQHVVELGGGWIDSPTTHSVLAAFANHLRTRAVDEMAAGRRKLADDLASFAVQASQLAWRVPESPPSPPTNPKTETTELPQIDVALLEPRVSTEILDEPAKPVTKQKRRHSVAHYQPQGRVVQLEVSTTPPPMPTAIQRLFISVGSLFHRQPRPDGLRSFY